MAQTDETGTRLSYEENLDNRHQEGLAQRLRRKQQTIEKDESEFRLRVWSWEANVAEQQKSLHQREQEVARKEVELRELQFQLLKIQDQIINSQLALQEVTEKITQPVNANEREASLKLLHKELTECFAVVEARWMKVVSEMKVVANYIANEVRGPYQIELD